MSDTITGNETAHVVKVRKTRKPRAPKVPKVVAPRAPRSTLKSRVAAMGPFHLDALTAMGADFKGELVTALRDRADYLEAVSRATDLGNRAEKASESAKALYVPATRGVEVVARLDAMAEFIGKQRTPVGAPRAE